MSHERNLKYLNDNRIVYRRMPIADKPTVEATYWDHYVRVHTSVTSYLEVKLRSLRLNLLNGTY